MTAGPGPRPVALVTGASRRIGIGAAVARRFAVDGWDVTTTVWRPYDDRMPWGRGAGAEELTVELRAVGAASLEIEADLADPAVPDAVLSRAEEGLGPVRALVLCHCDDPDGGLLEASLDDFDRSMAVNARASWLLIQAFARRFAGPHGSGRIVALTSGQTVGSLAYGAGKGALERIVLAAAEELAELGITANVVDPGPTDTGWMDDELRDRLAAANPLGRVGRPEDAANLVSFLCGEEGGWINGQRLFSDGGRGRA